MTVKEEVRQRIALDPELIRIRKKIESGKATYADTAAYSNRSGKLLGEFFSQRLPEIPLEEREPLCVELLRDRYVDINAAVDTAQRYMDEARGIRVAPQHAPYNDERSHQIGSSLRDLSKPTTTLQRRARAATETATKAIHDDRMKSEADFRSRAGFKCFLTRTAVGGCCPWCSDVAGRYVYGDQPDDIFGRHDNCDCTVTFENGRQRQDVWSKREWEAPEPGAGAGERVVLTEEQAKALQAEKGLTILPRNGTIKSIKAENFIQLERELSESFNIELTMPIIKMDFAACKEALDGFETMCLQYPEISNLAKSIRVTREDVINFDGEVIRFNPLYFNDIEKLRQVCKKQSASRYWIQDSSPASLMVHDSAHAVERLLINMCPDYTYDFEREDAWNTCKEAGKIVERAVSEMLETEYGRGKTEHELRQELSRYALQSYSETMAEAFADVYVHGENANPLSIRITEITHEQYDRYKNILNGGNENDG